MITHFLLRLQGEMHYFWLIMIQIFKVNIFFQVMTTSFGLWSEWKSRTLRLTRLWISTEWNCRGRPRRSTIVLCGCSLTCKLEFVKFNGNLFLDNFSLFSSLQSPFYTLTVINHEMVYSNLWRASPADWIGS
jgi:hypothetical protein